MWDFIKGFGILLTKTLLPHTTLSVGTCSRCSRGSSSTRVPSAIVSVNLCNQACRDFGVVLVQASLRDDR